MVNRNIVLLIAASLVIAPSANVLFGIDYFKNPTPSTTATPKLIPQPSDTNDAALTKAIKDAFNANSDLAASANFVSVNTTNGIVTLSGTVNSQKAKSDFENAAKSVAGVTQVINNLEVKAMI